MVMGNYSNCSSWASSLPTNGHHIKLNTRQNITAFSFSLFAHSGNFVDISAAVSLGIGVIMVRYRMQRHNLTLKDALCATLLVYTVVGSINPLLVICFSTAIK